MVQKVLLDILDGEEFCTCNPHLEGTEVFGSQKRSPNTLIGADEKTHRPDTVNFSCPRVSQRTTRSHTTSLPTIIEESSPSMQEVALLCSTGLNFHRVTVVEETKVDEKL